MFVQFLINGLITGVLYSLLAIGFALVYNTTRVFHIAAAALYVFAAYMFYFFSVGGPGLPLVFAGGVSLLLTAGLSLLMDVSVYRPLERRGADGNVSMIASIAMMTVVVNLMVMLFGSEMKSVMTSSSHIYAFPWGQLATPQLVQLMVGGTVLVLSILVLAFSRWGLRLKALSGNGTLYEMLGRDNRAARSRIFLASGLFIALSACLSAYDQGLDAYMGMDMLVNAMVAMILGGVGRYGACVVGGLTLGVVQSLVVGSFSSHWEGAITFALLLVLLFLRPQGIAGYKERRI